MTAVTFTLISEGSSDTGLVPHLQVLCVRAGASEAIGSAPNLGLLDTPPGHSVREKAQAILDLGSEPDILFVHRDADNRTPASVRDEISEAIDALSAELPWVAVIPVRELEAWLLLDATAIREVAGNPGGRLDLELPRARDVESTTNPKEVLQSALLRASGGVTGRRRRAFVRNFGTHRRILLERLAIDGVITSLPAWRQLVDDVETVISSLATVSLEERVTR